MKFNDNFLKMDLYRGFFNSAGDNFHNIFVKLYIPVRIRTLFQKGMSACSFYSHWTSNPWLAATQAYCMFKTDYLTLKKYLISISFDFVYLF